MGIFEMLNDDDFYYNCCLSLRHDLRVDREKLSYEEKIDCKGWKILLKYFYLNFLKINFKILHTKKYF
jgi:hypothetical protein